ncbi:MAG: MFS transporter [Gammaproteobacteria bacterium]|nr:MAG: MFS transporter [Gammaproteobacteria bacterium]
MNPLERKSLVGLASLYAFRMVGLFMLLPVLALYAGQYAGSSAFLVGLALGVYGLTQGVFQIPLGFLSDRVGRKPVIVGGMLMFLAGSLLAALTDSMWGLIAGRAMQGAGAVASTIMALLSDLTTEQNRTKAMAAVGGSIGISFAFSMIFGPILASKWGLSGLFWIAAVLAIVGILILLLVIPTPATITHNAEAEAVPEMFGRLLRDSDLLRLNLGIGVLHFAQMASWVAVPVLLEQNLHFPRDQHWTIYLGAMGLSFLCMLPFIILAETRRKMKPVFVAAVLVLGVGEVLLGTGTEHRWLFVFGLFVFFMGFNLLEATLPSLVSKSAPAGGRGTAMGIYSTSQFLGAFAGGVSGGYVAHQYGYEQVFWLASGLILLWLVVASTMKKPRHLKSLVVSLHPEERITATDFVGKVPGVFDVVVMQEHHLAYFKVDHDLFNSESMEEVLGRPIESTA